MDLKRLKEFDVVELDDGRQATVLELYPGTDEFESDIVSKEGYPTTTIKKVKIKRIVWTLKNS